MERHVTIESRQSLVTYCHMPYHLSPNRLSLGTVIHIRIDYWCLRSPIAILGTVKTSTNKGL